MEYARTIRQNWTSVCLLVLTSVASSGCAKVYHALHYNPVSLAMHENVKTYYHSDKTGRIIPKDQCYCPEEPPCYGYEPTCWTRWPADCPKCPIDCECEQPVVVHDQVVAPIQGSVIGQPTEAAPADAPAEVEDLISPASPSDAVEPDYEDSAALAPVIPADAIPNYRSNVPAEIEAPLTVAIMAEATM